MKSNVNNNKQFNITLGLQI